jgi:molybdopterin/thiamine biosynthesis adenylyltransferase
VGTAPETQLDSTAIRQVFRKQAQLVICCANTLTARLTAERLAIASSIPVVQAATFDGRERFGGILHIRRPQMPNASCFGCLLGADPDPEFRRGEGLLPAVTAILGHLAAHLAILELAEIGQAFPGNLLIADLDAGAFETITVDRRHDCAVCGQP